MGKKIAILQGHPDPDARRFVRALADRYRTAAIQAGHEVSVIDVAGLDFPILRSQADWKSGVLPQSLRHAQQDLFSADHLVVLFPLWLGTMPALLKAFFEQILRIDGPLNDANSEQLYAKPLAKKSVRIVVTMGMPAMVFRWFFQAHGVKCLERNILAFCGAGPIRRSLIGSIEADPRSRRRWLEKVSELGRAGR